MITSPPSYGAIRSAFRDIEREVKARISETYALRSGETATHYLWEGRHLKEGLGEGHCKDGAREFEPSSHDALLIDQLSAYRSRFVRSPRFFSNGRINASRGMTLDSLLTPRAQHNLDMLMEAISACPATVRMLSSFALRRFRPDDTDGFRSHRPRKNKRKNCGKGGSRKLGDWILSPASPFRGQRVELLRKKTRRLLSALEQMGDTPSIRFSTAPQNVVEGQGTCFIGLTDCRRGLERLPAGSCSLIITDPPHSDRVPYLELIAFGTHFWP